MRQVHLEDTLMLRKYYATLFFKLPQTGKLKTVYPESIKTIEGIITGLKNHNGYYYFSCFRHWDTQLILE
jgi:hypothetical protein